MRKFLIAVGGAILFLGLNSGVFAADFKMGVVDLKKVLDESPQAATMRAKMQGQFAPRDKEISMAGKALQADIEKFNKDGAVMKEPERKALQDKIVAGQKKVREMQENFQQNLATTQDQFMQTISKQVQGIVDKIAKDKQYDVVLVKAVAAYSKAELDITDDVIKEMKK